MDSQSDAVGGRGHCAPTRSGTFLPRASAPGARPGAQRGESLVRLRARLGRWPRGWREMPCAAGALCRPGRIRRAAVWAPGARGGLRGRRLDAPSAVSRGAHLPPACRPRTPRGRSREASADTRPRRTAEDSDKHFSYHNGAGRSSRCLVCYLKSPLCSRLKCSERSPKTPPLILNKPRGGPAALNSCWGARVRGHGVHRAVLLSSVLVGPTPADGDVTRPV